MLQFTYSNLILSGAHIGHTIKNTLFMASWMLFSIRQDVWMINLFKTIYMFKIGFKIIKAVVSRCGPIWFINMDKAMKLYIKFSANNAGEFYICDYWCKGIVSNFKEVHKSFRNLVSDTSISAMKPKKIDFFQKSWFFTRFSWPRFLFVSNILSCPSSASEALNLGIGCLAIVDTNISSQAINIAVPGNDESSSSIIFYNELVCTYILLCKFKSIILWLINVRNFWKLNSMKKNLYVKKKNIFKFNHDSVNFFSKSLSLIFTSGFLSSIDADYTDDSFVCQGFDSFRLVSILFRKNFRFFSILSRFYRLKNAINRNSFFKGLNKSWQWKGKLQKFLFWKLRLKAIISKNVKFGFKTLKYLWRFINRKSYLKFAKKDLWFSRVWSSYFLNYFSLYNQIYNVSIDRDSWVAGSYENYNRYLGRLIWSKDIIDAKFKFRNWRRRFLRYLNFTSIFYYFKNNLLYYLSFPLKKFHVLSNKKRFQKKNSKLWKFQLMNLKSKLKVQFRLNLLKKKKVLIKNLWKRKKTFYIGFWNFDNKIINKFYWRKFINVVEDIVPVSFLFFFKFFLGKRAYLLIPRMKIKKPFKSFMFNKFCIIYV